MKLTFSMKHEWFDLLMAVVMWIVVVVITAVALTACSGPQCLADPPPVYYAGRNVDAKGIEYRIDIHCAIQKCADKPCPIPAGVIVVPAALPGVPTKTSGAESGDGALDTGDPEFAAFHIQDQLALKARAAKTTCLCTRVACTHAA